MGREPIRWSANVLSTVSAGILIGITNLMLVISFATLVFSGVLAPFLPGGIGYFLFGALAIGLVIALLGSFSHAVAIPQDTPSVLIAVMAAAVASVLGTEEPAKLFYTVLAMMAFASLITGACFVLMGAFRLGNLVRYMPYPVIGGFLAGTGLLLAEGALVVMAGRGIGFQTVPYLLQPEILLRWVPGVLLAFTILVIIRRYRKPLLLPGLLLSAMLLFHLGLKLAGVSIEMATGAGWLLGPFPEGALWQPWTPAELQQVEWSAMFTQRGTLETLVLITLLSFLLNASGLELALRQDVDVNRELKVVGMANALSGLGGGPVGYHILSTSILSHKLGPNGRLVSVVAVMLYAFTLAYGADFLMLFPTFVLGGILFFLGLDFLVTWLVASRHGLSHSEYGIVVLIALVMVGIGVLEGVAFGLFLAMALFVVAYGRNSPIRSNLPDEVRRSNTDRSPAQRRLLEHEDNRICTFELQRFIFFGTANQLFEAVRQRVTSMEMASPEFVIIDFQRVSGLDASALSTFVKMQQLARIHDFMLLLTALPTALQRQLLSQLEGEEESGVRFFADLDHGIEWCEERILEEQGDPENEGLEPTRYPAVLADLIEYMELHTLASGECLIRQGERPPGLYFLQSGCLTSYLEYQDGRTVRLRKMRPGVFIGELSLYTDSPASASVLADQESTVLYLARKDLGRLEQTRPDIAAAFHKLIAEITSARLMDTTRSIAALMR
jgi:sulfate permease, SulP family